MNAAEENDRIIDEIAATLGVTEDRHRPTRYINCLRLTLERGDGECIDIGEVPHLNSALSIAEFVVWLNEAVKRCGQYNFRGDMEWSPRQLEFRVEDKPGN